MKHRKREALTERWGFFYSPVVRCQHRDYMTLIYSLLVDPPLRAARICSKLANFFVFSLPAAARCQNFSKLADFFVFVAAPLLPVLPAARNGQNLQILLTFTFTCTNPQDYQEILR